MTLTKKKGSRRRFAGAAMTGDELRRKRIKAGLSQRALAAEAGYNPVYLGSLEMGQSRITPRAAALLLAVIARSEEA